MDRWFGKKKKVEVPSPLGGASLAGTTDASSPYADPAIAEADAAINQALGSSSAIPMTSVGVDTPAVPAAAVTVTAPSSSGMPSPPGSPTPSSLPLDSVYGPSTTLAGGSSTASMVGGPTSPSGSAPGTPGEPAGPGLPPMESLSPYTQQLIKDHKKAAVTGAAAGAAGKDTAIPIDYASNPLDKLKEMRPGTKRKVLFGSLSFIFLLAGIIGVVVSWYYAYNPGPQSNQLLSLYMAAELIWLSLAAGIASFLGPPPQLWWQIGEIFAWVVNIALCIGTAITYGYQYRTDATGWMAACTAVSVIGLVACIFGRKEGWFDPERKTEGSFTQRATKVSLIVYRVLMGVLTIANFVMLGFLLGGGISSAQASHEESPPIGRMLAVPNVGNIHVYCDGPSAGVIRTQYLLDVDFGANHFDMLGLLQSLALSGARVCVYDRPGYGFSDYPVNYPRTDDQIVREIRLITEEMVTNVAFRFRKPFNYVGHGKGGMLAWRYAEQYPQDLAGLALLDSWPQNAPYINSGMTGGPNYTAEDIAAAKDSTRRDLDRDRGFYGPAGLLRLRFAPLPKDEPFIPAEFEGKRYASYMHDKTWASQYHEFRNNERLSWVPGPLLPNIRILSVPVQTTPADANNYFNKVMREYVNANNNTLNRVVNCTDGCTHGFPYTRPTWLAAQLTTVLPN